MKYSTSAVLLAALMLAGSSPSAHAADKWVSVRSQNFLLAGNASETRIRELAIELERFRAAFALLFPGAGQESSAATTVIVFKDDAAFRPYKPLYQGKPGNVAGFFQPGADRNFIAMNGDIDTPSLIYHEFVHSLTRDATRRLPSWVNEGLAEFYSTFRTDASGRNVELGRPVTSHVLLLRERQLIPLATFLAVDTKSPFYNEESKQGIFYAQSWALVHYLQTGRNGARRAQLSQYLSLVAGGKPLDESFQEAFLTDYAGIEKELREYVRQLTMNFFKVPLPERLEFEKTMATVAVSDAQAAAWLGDMMVHMGRNDLAEKELARAIEFDPALAASYVSMGMLRLRQDRDKDALALLSKAVDGDSRDHLAHVVYAQLLEKLAAKESDDEHHARLELMRTHVRKAIELAPHFVEAYGMLAYVTVALEAGYEETETALLKAIAFAPGRDDLQLHLANVLAADGKMLAARTVASTVRRATTDDEVRRQCDTLLAYVQTQIDSQQALRDYEARRAAAAAQGTPAPQGAAGDPLADPPAAAVAASAASASTPAASPAAPRATARPAGLQVEGFLTEMECADGLKLHVRTEQGMVVLHSDMPSTINFVSYVAALKDSIRCGAFTPPPHVIVVYKRTANPAYLGDPVAVEFRP